MSNVIDLDQYRKPELIFAMNFYSNGHNPFMVKPGEELASLYLAREIIAELIEEFENDDSA